MGFAILIFPPRYGSSFFGLRTKVTLKNEIIWAAGQKLFAYSLLIIGLMIILFCILEIGIGIMPLLLFIGVRKLTEYFIDKFLLNKFSDV